MHPKTPRPGTFLLTLALAAIPHLSYAALTTEQRLADFNQMVTTFQRNYAPLRLKEKTIGLNFQQHVDKFRAKVQESKNDGEFYRLLASFLAGFKDGHVKGLVPTGFSAELGVLFEYVDGKVLVDLTNSRLVNEQNFPFKRGDQLLAIDGVPVEQKLNELAQYNATGSEHTTRRFNTLRLTMRMGQQGVPVPTGSAQLTILPRGKSEPQTITLPWVNDGKETVDLEDLKAAAAEVSATKATSSASSLGIYSNPLFQGGFSKQAFGEFYGSGTHDIGHPKSFFKLPDGAKQIPGIPFTAVVYQAAGKKIGILRIPTFQANTGQEIEAAMMLIGRCVMVMEQNADVLVIDQTDNPGGNIALASELMRLFAAKEYRDIAFQIRPSLKWQMGYDEIISKISVALRQDPKDSRASLLRGRYQDAADENRNSMLQRSFLTKPFSLNIDSTNGVITPHEVVTYSKPLLILINELDFSSADFFPAVLKDNGRAVLFGAKTSGAGGNVEIHGPLANSFYRFTVTESLMVRPNGEYVENNGVKPDVAYNITDEDFLGGFKGYVKAFTLEALKLAGAAPEKIEEFKNK